MENIMKIQFLNFQRIKIKLFKSKSKKFQKKNIK